MHAALEEQYMDLFQALDDLAERIRTLGAMVPASFARRDGADEGGDLVGNLIAAHELAVKSFGEAIEVADDADDDVTEGLLLDRLGFHQKTLWMLRASRG
jgi:starvation-inducible DNA-binding protein